MFELSQPWVLLLAFLPPLIWFLLPPVKLKLSTALVLPFYESLLKSRREETSFYMKPLDLLFFSLIWLCLIFALAGPRWIGEPIPLTREGRNIMLVLDLSGSMDINDMELNGQPASRLAVVKKTAVNFVKARTGDRIGLILFATQAYLQTPLTFDRNSILLRLYDASVGLAGNTTSIGDALGLAVKRLKNVPKESRVVILLTDGANNSGVLAPLKAAELAHDEKIKVYTIGLGSEAQPFNQALLNFNPGAELDEKTLEEIASLTGGQYFRATDTRSLQNIYSTINALEKVKGDSEMFRPEKNYYAWPLGLAFLLFILWQVFSLFDLNPWLKRRRVNGF